MEEKITETTRETFGLIRDIGAVVDDVRDIAVSIDPAAATAPAPDLPPIIREHLDITTLRAELAEARLTIIDLQTRLGETASELETTSAELRSTQTALNDAHAELSEKQKQLEELGLARDYVQTLEMQVDELTAAHDRLAAVVAERLPDLVAVCSDDADAYFSFSRNTKNNYVGFDAVVHAPHGILTRDMLPDGCDSINLYSMAGCVYLNLQGFVRLFNRINAPELTQNPVAEPIDSPVQCRLIAGVTNVQELEWLQAPTLAEANMYGDWSAAPLKYINMIFSGDKWSVPCPTTRLPKITFSPTITSITQGYAVSCDKVRRFPDVDLASAVLYRNLYVAYNNETPPTLETHARVRNIGAYLAEKEYERIIHFSLLRNWNYEDMRYSLVEASLTCESPIKIVLHPDAYARLTDEDKALITAKNYTITTQRKSY